MGVRSFTKFDIAQEVRYLMQLPPTKTFESSKAYKIVTVVIDAITNALMRGETVTVHGFGTFKVKTRAAHKHHSMYFFDKNGMYREMIPLPAKKYVHFKASKGLRRFVEEGCKDVDVS